MRVPAGALHQILSWLAVLAAVVALWFEFALLLPRTGFLITLSSLRANTAIIRAARTGMAETDVLKALGQPHEVWTRERQQHTGGFGPWPATPFMKKVLVYQTHRGLLPGGSRVCVYIDSRGRVRSVIFASD